MIRRLRIKFVCVTMAVAAILLAVLFATVVHFTRSELEAESIRAMASAALEPPGPARPGERSARLPCFTLQMGPRGNLLVSGDSAYDLTDLDFLRAVLEEALRAGGESGILEARKLRYLRTGSPGRPVLVFADASGEARTLENLIRTCLLAGSGALLVLLGVSILLSRWAVRPVDEAWKQQRQFVADASHELKTPLTVILTNAELLESGGADPAARARFAENILAMARQMRTLTEALLELARADSGQAVRAVEPVDLSCLAQEALLPFEPVFFERNLTLESDVTEGLWVKGDALRLRQTMEALLDNAQKYTAPGGAVSVCLYRQGRYGIFSVSGPGEALSPEACRDVFKRFYRADAARGQGGGYGLGLAIAEEVIQAHGGKIWAESRQGENTFRFRLPLL